MSCGNALNATPRPSDIMDEQRGNKNVGAPSHVSEGWGDGEWEKGHGHAQVTNGQVDHKKLRWLQGGLLPVGHEEQDPVPCHRQHACERRRRGLWRQSIGDEHVQKHRRLLFLTKNGVKTSHEEVMILGYSGDKENDVGGISHLGGAEREWKRGGEKC